MSGLSGVVENLSIRTIRLRAGDGSVHIVPFSSVTSVTNTNRGIGNVMMTASSNFNVPLVFAGLFVLAGLGVALYAVFSMIERRVTGWATRKNDLITT